MNPPSGPPLPAVAGRLQRLRVCLAQINTTVGDFPGNRQKIIRSLREAKRRGAHLVTFPELTVTGYPPEDLLFSEKFVSENIRMLRSLLPHTAGILAVVGFVDRDVQKRLYNAAAVLTGGRIAAVYRKVCLPNYGVFDEKRYFAAGEKETIVETPQGIRIGFSICEDIWQKDSFLYRKDFSGRVSLLVNISASPYHVDKGREREALLKTLAVRVRCPVVYQNLIGGQDELVFDGGSMVLDGRGGILARLASFEEETAVVDVTVKSKRSPNRPARPLSQRHVAPRLARPAQIYKALVLGSRDYVEKNGFKRVLVGVSGGIDSAIVACIAVDALGRDRVIGVTMPSVYTSEETLEDAKALCRRLGIRCLEIPIQGIFSTYLETLRSLFKGRPADVTEENLQARIRGTLLMALSNKWGCLVLTTGNKSEMATGYCTLYGDMAGGFAVIKDVPKTWVFRLARYRNSLSRREKRIPERLLKRAPTAELRPNQKDEDTLPPYPLLDKFLEGYVEKDWAVDRIASRRIPAGLALRMARMVWRNEYKRRQAPPGIKITPKAFGRDRRMPITNRYLS